MGKRLIIKGADFSEVSVRKEIVYSELFADIDWSTPNTDASNPQAKCLYGRCVDGFDFSKTDGKKVVGVKVNVKGVYNGVAQVGVVRGFRNLAQPGQVATIPNLMDITEVQNVYITKVGVQAIMLETPIILGPNDWIGIGNMTIPVTGSIVPNFRNYDGTFICYVNGTQESSIPNSIDDKSNVQGYYGFVGIDYLYED